MIGSNSNDSSPSQGEFRAFHVCASEGPLVHGVASTLGLGLTLWFFVPRLWRGDVFVDFDQELWGISESICHVIGSLGVISVFGLSCLFFLWWFFRLTYRVRVTEHDIWIKRFLFATERRVAASELEGHVVVKSWPFRRGERVPLDEVNLGEIPADYVVELVVNLPEGGSLRVSRSADHVDDLLEVLSKECAEV